MLIIGIDPGISGSICFFKDGKILDAIDMPTMTEGKKNKKQVNGAQVHNEILKRINTTEKQNIRVIIELVSAMPGQGVTSMFNFGQSFGILKGICSAMLLPMYFVRPAKWKKYFGLINSEKDGNISIALVLLASFSELIKLKYFFHLAGLMKYMGNCIAEQIPFKIPKDCPKLNILVTP